MSYLSIADEMKKFKKEIEDHQEIYEGLRFDIKSILGEDDFKGLYAFFLKLLTNAAIEYLIFMSRRCLVLCQIFIIFILLDDCKLNEKLIVLSDKAIPYYGRKMKGKVAIADDILIHGRTIGNVYKLLKEYNKNLQVQIFGYTKDTAPLKAELQSITSVESIESKSEWRNLSNKIVRCIYASNVPYTSFVTAFFQYGNNDFLNTLRNIESVHIIENTDESQRYEGLCSFYCYEKDNKFLSELTLEKGIRLYWNKHIEKLTIIPYVFIRRLTLKDANCIFEQVASNLPAKYQSLIEILKERSENQRIDDTLTTYKMRVLTCLLSRLYWLDFLQRHNLQQIDSVDVDTLEKSFGQEIAEIIINIKLEEVTKLLTMEFKVLDGNEQLEKKSCEIWGKCCEGKSKERLRKFFQKVWYEDECRAKKGVERCEGLSIDYLLICLENNEEHRQKILAILVNIWDMGIAAANYTVDSVHGSVACYNTPGEQSYRIILENYPYLFMYLIAASKLLRNEDAKNNEEFGVFRTNFLLDLLEILHKDQEIKDYEGIEEIIRSEQGYLNAWNQISVINRAKKGDSRKNQLELVYDFINKRL